MQLNSEFNELKTLIDENVVNYLPRVELESRILFDAMEYSLLVGGKRLRPVLCLSAYRLAAGRDAELSFALPFACAIEFIQTYSLIHDDLPAMDNDDYRRGKLTNHKVYGEDIAILAGDGLLSAAYELMSKDMLSYLERHELLARKTLALQAIADGTGCMGMVAGQVADVQNEGKPVSESMLDFIDRNKTAAFFEASVMAGLYLGGADEELLCAGKTYAENMGIAFQVCDDILDIIGDPAKRGKNVGMDAELGKTTFPAVYGLEKSYEIAYAYLDMAYDAVKGYGERASVLLNILEFVKDSIKR